MATSTLYRTISASILAVTMLPATAHAQLKGGNQPFNVVGSLTAILGQAQRID